ncbi:hypothetical protein [Acinetobacter sp. BSP-28]
MKSLPESAQSGKTAVRGHPTLPKRYLLQNFLAETAKCLDALYFYK